MGQGTTKVFTATATHGGQPYNGTVTWDTAGGTLGGQGSFSPAQTNTGQGVTFTAPSSTGTLYITATINGITVMSLVINIT